MLSNIFNKTRKEADWISISDLMTGLMMIFLFIAISYMNSLQLKAKQIKKIAVAYQEIQNNLYNDLYREFKKDLVKWKAEIDRDLVVRFNEPRVLFKQNSCDVTPYFQDILSDFFPRYLSILNSDKYNLNIEEIRIEGHTSSEWTTVVDAETAYFNNMRLSQDRTRSVLEYCLGLIEDGNIKEWSRKHITANGLSSSHLLFKEAKEDSIRSRRVEFRTKTAAHKKIVEIIEEMKET